MSEELKVKMAAQIMQGTEAVGEYCRNHITRAGREDFQPETAIDRAAVESLKKAEWYMEYRAKMDQESKL